MTRKSTQEGKDEHTSICTLFSAADDVKQIICPNAVRDDEEMRVSVCNSYDHANQRTRWTKDFRIQLFKRWDGEKFSNEKSLLKATHCTRQSL